MRTRIGFSLLCVAAMLSVSSSSPIEGADHAYVGSKRCKMCHMKEWQSWSETKMAKAFDVLKPGVSAEAKKKAQLDPGKDYTTDPTCLGCHTTGYGKAGGFVSLESSPELAGVGCEMCHGAGGTYTEPQYMSLKNKEYKKADVVAAGLTASLAETQCTVCHNMKSPFVGADYHFDFDEMKTKGTHEKFPLKYQH